MSRSVVVRGSSGLRQALSVGPHKLVADEPEQAGSHDEGPDPYEYLLAALGACTNMTLRMYADRKRWPLREVRTVLSHAKSYAADCEHCDQPDALIDRIERQITLFGDLSEEQRTQLLQIADRCPIHRTLTSKIVIRTALVAALPQ